MKEMRSLFVIVHHARKGRPGKLRVEVRALDEGVAAETCAVARRLTPDGYRMSGSATTSGRNRTGTGSNGKRRKVVVEYIRTASGRETKSIQELRDYFAPVWAASLALVYLLASARRGERPTAPRTSAKS